MRHSATRRGTMLHGAARCGIERGPPAASRAAARHYLSRPPQARKAATLCRPGRSQPESRYSQPDIILLYLRSVRRVVYQQPSEPRVSLLLSSTRLAVSHSLFISRSLPCTFDAPFTSPRPLRFSSLFSYRRLVFTALLRAAPSPAAPRRAGE